MFFSYPCASAGGHGKRWRLAACALCAAALAMPPAGASDKDDHDRARQAVQAGQVLEVELEQERDRWIYEVKLLTPAGQLTKVKLDARTGEVLRIKPRDDQRLRREHRPDLPRN